MPLTTQRNTQKDQPKGWKEGNGYQSTGGAPCPGKSGPWKHQLQYSSAPLGARYFCNSDPKQTSIAGKQHLHKCGPHLHL